MRRRIEQVVASEADGANDFGPLKALAEDGVGVERNDRRGGQHERDSRERQTDDGGAPRRKLRKRNPPDEQNQHCQIGYDKAVVPADLSEQALEDKRNIRQL